MNNSQSYSVCYQVLQISPGCSWKELRKAFKSQAHKWHPDRYPDEEKDQAQTRFLQLNAAFQQLEEYYKTYHQLPAVERPTPAKPAPEQKPSDGVKRSAPDRQTPPAFRAKARSTTGRKSGTSRPSPKYASLGLVALGTIATVLLWPETDDTDMNPVYSSAQPNEPLTTEAPSESVAATEEPAEPGLTETTPEEEQESVDTALDKDLFFTYGSTIGEVILIQGTPSRMDGDIWYYGDSEVIFYNGRVSRWHRGSEVPLKAMLKSTDPSKLHP